MTEEGAATGKLNKSEYHNAYFINIILLPGEEPGYDESMSRTSVFQ